jgi:transglutaminase-like putative cysteine protease
LGQTPTKSSHKIRNIGIAVLVILVLIIASIAVIYFETYIPTPITATPTPTPIPLIAVLKVDGGVTNGYWTRDVTTDLPDYESTVSYSVSDVGNLDASSVSISISINGNLYSSNVIPSITTSYSYSSSFSYSTPYDQTKNVLIQASCQDSSDSYTLSIGSTFPSSPYDASGNLSPTIAELYVTPHEQNLVTIKNSILNSKFLLDPDWTAIWEWVGSHITYETENSASYHWQFPFETLQSKYGMCADYSTLLVSMYRDGVFGPNDVYVVCGTNGQGGGHAWVIVRLPIVGWYQLDPQENGGFLLNLVSNPFIVSGYTGQFEFNDQQFNPISS